MKIVIHVSRCAGSAGPTKPDGFHGSTLACCTIVRRDRRTPDGILKQKGDNGPFIAEFFLSVMTLLRVMADKRCQKSDKIF
jgi:hypothetical protein